jgi:hypothetical protein
MIYETDIRFMSSLVVVEPQRTICAFNYECWGEATQHRGLVVFRRIKLGDYRIIFIDQLRITCRTDANTTHWVRKTKIGGTWDAEDMARRN